MEGLVTTPAVDPTEGSGFTPDTQTPEVQGSVEPTSPEMTQPDLGTQTDQQPQKPTVDWEARFKGLQRRYDMDRQRYQELEQRALAYEEALIEQVTRDLPDEQREQQAQQLQMAAQLRRMYEATMQQAQANEERDRLAVIDYLSRTHGVDPWELAQFDRPEAMEFHAISVGRREKALAQLARQQQRQTQGADRFEGQGVPAPPKPITNEDDAADAFMQAVQRLGGLG